MEVKIFRPNQVTEPMGQFKNFADCMDTIGNERICGSIKAKTESKIKECESKKMIFEMVDWTTYVRPGDVPDMIEGELLHVTVSGNGVDYTAEELLSAVNTLIGKPIYEVTNNEDITLPEDLHHDPAKKKVGEIKLAKYRNGSINFLAQVDHETWLRVKSGERPIGSIEAKYAVEAESEKRGAIKKPEFITFEGYMLLPPEGTMTKFGETSGPGDRATKNQVFEQIKMGWGCGCPSKMMEKKTTENHHLSTDDKKKLQKKMKVSLFKSY